MILSKQHRFIFVAVPHTGSSAIEKELVELYGGKPVRDKHSLPFFLPRQYRNFRIIGGVRHPLSDLVSTYFKYKTDHGGLYSAHLDGTLQNRFMGRRDISLFKQVQCGMTLSSYIDKKVNLPHIPRVSLGPRPYDFVYRTEDLEEDFSRMLQSLGIEVQRPLLRRNPTEKKDDVSSVMRDYSDHPSFSVACHEFGYTDKEPDSSTYTIYNVARSVKRSVYIGRTLRSLSRTKGAYGMRHASRDADEELGNVH